MPVGRLADEHEQRGRRAATPALREQPRPARGAVGDLAPGQPTDLAGRVDEGERAAAILGREPLDDVAGEVEPLRDVHASRDPALEVVLAHRAEDVEDERALGPAVRRVLDPARKHIALERAELARDTVDDERLHPPEHDPELLVRVAVERHGRARLEVDQVQHRALAEERPPDDAVREQEATDVVEADELRRCHRTIIVVRVTAVESDLLRRQAYVDGRWVDADSGATFAVVNPATGETIAEVPRMGAAETRRAIEAAQRALPGLEGDARRRSAPAILRRLADLMLEHAGRPRRAAGHRAGQAARRGARRDRLRRLVLRVVRRGGEARLRRHDPDAAGRTGASSSRRSRSASPPGSRRGTSRRRCRRASRRPRSPPAARWC